MTTVHNRHTINRITALWALNEGGLGGILHAIGSPFTGLIVGSTAILLISLLAYFSRSNYSTIFKSMLIVLIIKLAISPYSPPTSYLSVVFETACGAFIFNYLGFNKWSTMLLGVITLVFSALLKILSLTIIFGMTFWRAINEVLDQIQNILPFISDVFSSQFLISAYVISYMIFGLIVGYSIYSIVEYLDENQGNVKYQISAIVFDLPQDFNKKRRSRWQMGILWIALLSLMVAYYLFYKEGDRVWRSVLYIILRSGSIILIWYYLIGPFFTKWLRNFLSTKEHQVSKEVSETMTLLPFLKNIVELSWKENKEEKGWNKIKGFIGDTILYSIFLRVDEDAL
jgi:hypothetical protein